MSFNEIRRVRILSIIATFLLMFSLINPTFANLERNNDVQRSEHDSNLEPIEKVNDRLLKEFEDHDEVTFLVKFKDKTDVKKVANEVEQKTEQSDKTAEDVQLIKRSSILSELKSTAFESQQKVTSFLEDEKEAGDVSDFHSYYIVNGMAVTATQEMAEEIASFPEVEKLLKNETRHLQDTVDPEEKAPQAEDDDIEWNVERIDAPEAWEMGIDGSGAVVASLDTGVQWDHPALKEKYRGYNKETDEVEHAYSFFDAMDHENTEPSDERGHGTHVTGTMVGSEADGSNQVGVAPGAEWITVKVFDQNDETTDAILLEGAEWLLAPGGRSELAPDVVNNSWGGGSGIDEWYLDTVETWRAYGIFPAFSAGNVSAANPGGPGSIMIPANYPISFATGATNTYDMLASFSLQGPSPYDGIKPDIIAPGETIRSAIPGSNYTIMSGTSMSSPAVSAVAAMLKSADANISVDEMEDVLKNSAKPLTDHEFTESPNNGYGYGMVNAEDAVSMIIEGSGVIEGTVTQEGSNDPLSAQVIVQETDRNTNTSLGDGVFTLPHVSGTYTVEANSYGHQSEQQTITLEEDENIDASFELTEFAKGTINGTVTNEVTGEPIEGAEAFLVDDANVEPVMTDENGHFTLSAYEGTYTLKIMATDYHVADTEVEITDETIDISFELASYFPYPTYPGGEIGYDDGTAENAWVYFEEENGWAVKMSLEEEGEEAIVTDGLFHFQDGSFPKPGGNDFLVEVWDASGEDGMPGVQLAGPIEAKAKRTGEDWTVVNLREHNIKVDDDFYMVYIQSDPDPFAPALSADESGPNAERSYDFYNGEWSQPNTGKGNYMIRSRVAYEAADPIILSPEEDFATDEEDLIIEGTASPTTTIQLKNNDEEVDTIEVEDDGQFSFSTTLTEGENKFQVVTLHNGSDAGESETVFVTLDSRDPELQIDYPAEGDKTNRETATVEGTVHDENLDYVDVNGQKADIDGNHFEKRILLDEGENMIEVTASDIVGNTTTETVAIEAKYNQPEIENVAPNTDVYLETGDSVKIEFDSEPGLNASYGVHMPLTNYQITMYNATELPMMETTPGHYVGYYTVTQNAIAEGAVIEVIATDDFDNKTYEEAEGKLFINTDE